MYNSCRIQKQKKEINGLKVKVIGFNGKERERERESTCDGERVRV